MSKKLTDNVWLYVFFALAVVLCQNSFDGVLAFGIFSGGVFALSPIVCLAVYLLDGVFYGTKALLLFAVRGAVIVLAYYLHKLFKKRANVFFFVVENLLANVFYCAFDTDGYFVLFDKIAFSLLAVAVSLVSLRAFSAFKRGIGYRATFDEMLAVSLFAVIVSYAGASFYVGNYFLTEFFAPCIILLCTVMLGRDIGFTAGVLVGLGYVFKSGNFDYFVFWITSTLVASEFLKVNRYVSAVSVVICDVVFCYFLSLHGAFVVEAFVPTVVSVIVFCCIPNKLINFVSGYAVGRAEKFSAGSILNRLRLDTSRKLYRLSDVFLSMKSTFFSMAVEESSDEDATKVITRHVCDVVCKDCDSYSSCWRKQIVSTEKAFVEIGDFAVKKGKVTILDAPQSLTVKCGRLSAVMSEINTVAERFDNKKKRIESANQSKMLIGEEMGGVSTVLKNLAEQLKGKIVFDSEREKEITDSLIFHNVMCAGTVIVDDGNGICVITTVPKENYDDDVLAKIVGDAVKQKMYVERIEKIGDEFINAFLKKEPRYSVTFGISSVQKQGSNVSGDTHSIVKTDNGKCIFTVCDGMGSGDVAEKMSNASITLVENFYRAGFDSDVILSCVNKLLSKSGNEVFCSVDICSLDLSTGFADFIKMGASYGLVKNGGKVEIISGSSLPLGVLDEMHPSVTKKALEKGDDVVLMSDGLADCFGDVNKLANVFAEANYTNPQTMADYLLDKALGVVKNKNADDITVLVAHLS